MQSEHTLTSILFLNSNFISSKLILNLLLLQLSRCELLVAGDHDGSEFMYEVCSEDGGDLKSGRVGGEDVGEGEMGKKRSARCSAEAVMREMSLESGGLTSALVSYAGETTSGELGQLGPSNEPSNPTHLRQCQRQQCSIPQSPSKSS